MAGSMAFERMKAMRLFAAELRATTIEVQKKGGDQYESQLYLTQTGLKASRVMIVGTSLLPAPSTAATPVSPPAAAPTPLSEIKPGTKAEAHGLTSPEDMKNFVEQKIISLNVKGKGVKIETLGNPCKGAGMTLIQLEAALKELMDEGKIYEPKVGIVIHTEA